VVSLELRSQASFVKSKIRRDRFSVCVTNQIVPVFFNGLRNMWTTCRHGIGTALQGFVVRLREWRLELKVYPIFKSVTGI
jgi:hypothetical protein